MEANANTLVTMGIISDKVYNDTPNVDYFVKGAILVANNTTYTVKDYADTATGMQALLLESGGQYVIAFRGTEPTSVMDWVTNFQTGVDNYNPQFNDALAFVNNILNDDELDIETDDLTLTGHSLGGILTQAIGAIFKIPGYAYNPWGSDVLATLEPDNVTDRLLQYLQRALSGADIPDPDINFAQENILNISYQDDGFLNGDILSNLATRLTSEHLGNFIPIWGKNEGFVGGHSIDTLVPAIEHANKVLDHFTQDTTYENLSKAYLLTGGFERVEDVFNDLGIYDSSNNSLRFNFLDDKLPSQLQNTDKANLYALKHLLPFTIQGDLPAYDTINSDNYSEMYVKDRAYYLYYTMDKENRYDKTPALNYYEDTALGDAYTLNKGDWNNKVIFGSNSKDDTLEGDANSDHLYGMGGTDTLKGGQGNDYLEGGSGSDELHGGAGQDILIGAAKEGVDDGASDHLEGGKGFDTYIAGNGDTIKDSDGEGLVKFDGIDLTGKKYKNSESGQYEDDDYIYEGDPEGTGPLTVKAKNGSKSITIQDWSNEDLGIELLDNKDIEVSITESATASEGDSGKRYLSFTVTLSRALEDGESLDALMTYDKNENGFTQPKAAA